MCLIETISVTLETIEIGASSRRAATEGDDYPPAVVPPSGYRFRAPTPGDFEAIADILRADELDDAGEVSLGADFVRDEWSEIGFDLATDAWVALDGEGSIVGYGQARQTQSTIVESWGVVDPVCRGRGIGGALLDLIEVRASEILAGSSRGRFRHSINAADTAAAELLEARSLRPLRHFWHMERTLPRPFEPGADPPGVSVTDFDPHNDLVEVNAVLSEALMDDTGYQPGRFSQWAEQEMRSPTYDPTLWQVAKLEGRAVGAVTGEAGDDGWISFLGVAGPLRGRGIGATLLRHLFTKFADRGIERVLVNVDTANPSKATAVYEGVGMQVIKRWDLWERTSTSSHDSSPF